MYLQLARGPTTMEDLENEAAKSSAAAATAAAANLAETAEHTDSDATVPHPEIAVDSGALAAAAQDVGGAEQSMQDIVAVVTAADGTLEAVTKGTLQSGGLSNTAGGGAAGKVSEAAVAKAASDFIAQIEVDEQHTAGQRQIVAGMEADMQVQQARRDLTPADPPSLPPSLVLGVANGPGTALSHSHQSMPVCSPAEPPSQQQSPASEGECFQDFIFQPQNVSHLGPDCIVDLTNLSNLGCWI